MKKIPYIAVLLVVGVVSGYVYVSDDNNNDTKQNIRKMFEERKEKIEDGSGRVMVVSGQRDGWQDYIVAGEHIGCLGTIERGQTAHGYVEVLGLDPVMFLADNAESINDEDELLAGKEILLRDISCNKVRAHDTELNNRYGA